MSAKFWAVVPAAGTGSRMQAERPKQYLPLAGSCVLAVTLEKLLKINPIQGVVVVIAEEDQHFAQLQFSDPGRIHITTGGRERADSVLAGLRYLLRHTSAKAHDSVLVHDAARPCVSLNSIERLINRVGTQPCGGILAVPVADTLKCATPESQEPRIQTTQDRRNFWLAQTPQLFSLGVLTEALTEAVHQAVQITDEASAVERLGIQPLLIEDRRDNLKITHPEDLWLAEQILRRQLETSL